MPNIDYMKVFDAIAAALNAADHINVDALDLNRFNVSIMNDDTSCIDFNAVLGSYDMELSVNKNALPEKEFTKFISLFEYHLEQKFLKNIELKSIQTSGEYKIKISF